MGVSLDFEKEDIYIYIYIFFFFQVPKKVFTLFSAIFHRPLCLMSAYLVPKSRSEHVHYNRDFKLSFPVSLGYVFVSRMD